jgi:microcystin-dependent protein
MTQPFLGQVQPMGFGFAPRNWALCNGQVLSISQNTALFALLGTMYGGNGTTTFALPNLQSRVPIHYGTFGGTPYAQGEAAGEESVTLAGANMPAHRHSFSGTLAAANSKQPFTGAAYAQSNKSGTSPADAYYAPDNSQQITSLHVDTVTPYGGGLPHANVQPYLTISWCIALAGIFPARN